MIKLLVLATTYEFANFSFARVPSCFKSFCVPGGCPSVSSTK